VLNMIHPFNYADIVIAAVVLFCMLISMRRGMLVEVIAIGSLLAAVFVAMHFGEIAAERVIGEKITDPAVRHYLAMGVLFVCTLFAGSALSYIVATFVKSGPLRGADRMLGAIFGLVRGVIIVCVGMTLLGLTATVSEGWWDRSVLIGHLQPVADWLMDQMPAVIQKIKSYRY